MSGIGKQSHGTGQQAERDFDNDVYDIERNAEREGPAEIGWHMTMGTLAVMMAVVDMSVIVVMVTGGHLRSDKLLSDWSLNTRIYQSGL